MVKTPESSHCRGFIDCVILDSPGVKGLREVGAGGAGRARNVQQVVMSSLTLFILLSWSKPRLLFTNSALNRLAVTYWPTEVCFLSGSVSVLIGFSGLKVHSAAAKSWPCIRSLFFMFAVL